MAVHRSLGGLASVLASIALAACAGGSAETPTAPKKAPIVHSGRNASTQVVVGATGSPEQRVLAQIDVEGLRAAGFRARVQGGFTGAPDALDGVATASIDVYPDYADGLLAAVGARPSPRMTAQDALGRLRARLANRDAEALPGAALTRGPGVVVAERTARRLHLRRISDLRKEAPHLRLAGPRGCQRRSDCLPALRRTYGLRFRRFISVRRDLVHEPIRSGVAAATIVPTTDPRIGRGREVVLRDDRHAFTGSPVVVVVRREVARQGGTALGSAIARAGSALTIPLMQELVARVEFDQRPSAAVAARYLRTSGLVRRGG
jgi:osmoprotectant transport system substrate-binding protein